MSFTCFPTSARTRAVAANLRSSSVARPRKVSNASSGNLESITMTPCTLGMRMTQSGRLPLESVNWKSYWSGAIWSAMIASMRSWPKAPRDCLLERISCRLTTWPDSAVMFFCASSMTVSRVWMPPSVSAVLVALSVRFSPSRLFSASMRSASMFCSCLAGSIVCWNRPAMSPWPCSTVSSLGSGRASSGAGRRSVNASTERRRDTAPTMPTPVTIRPISMPYRRSLDRKNRPETISRP